jgi:hypothetical protein
MAEGKSEGKYGKYIVTELKPKINRAPWDKPANPEEISTIMYLDDEVIKGAFYTEVAWFWPRSVEDLANDDVDVEPHKHEHAEVLACFGSDTKNPNDLGGELEVYLNGEKHIVTKSFMIFIPPGLEHGPIRFTRIDKPVFHFAVHGGSMYY